MQNEQQPGQDSNELLERFKANHSILVDLTEKAKQRFQGYVTAEQKGLIDNLQKKLLAEDVDAQERKIKKLTEVLEVLGS